MPGSPALRTWLAGTKARDVRDLYTFWFRSGVERWTSAAADATVGALTWTANRRISSDEQLSFVNRSNSTDPDELAVLLCPGGASLGGISMIHAADLGELSGTKVLVERYFPASGLAETLPLFTGYVEVAEVNGVTVRLTVKTRQAQATSSSPIIRLQAGCPFSLGDSMCGVNLATYTATKTIAAGSTVRSLVHSGAADPLANVGSVVTFSSGANSGRQASVETSSGSTLGIYPPLPVAPAVGDTFSVIKGCDKTLSACGAFSNRSRYIGFPRMPNPEATT